MSDALRELINETRARGLLESAPARPPAEVQRPEGDLGIGRGGAASAHQPNTSADVNQRIRNAVNLMRSATFIDGIGLDVDDPWG